MESMLSGLAGTALLLTNQLIAGAFFYLIVAYALMRWEQSKSGEVDRQTGLKLILFFLLIIGLGITTTGLQSIGHFVLSLGDAGSDAIKQGIAFLVAGGLISAFVYYVWLPRTNKATAPRAERLLVAYVAAMAGFAAATGFAASLRGIVTKQDWDTLTSAALANTIVFGIVTFIALSRFGTLSGWAPPPPRTPTHPGPGPGGGPANYGGPGYGGPGGPGQQMPPGYAPPGGAPPAGYPSGGGFPPPWGGPGPSGHKPGG